jgi:hypothetical protein
METSGDLPTMSDFPTRQEPGSLAPVEPLTSKTADGKPYERSASVQAEISRTLALHAPDWLREAPNLQNETLAYLIRRSQDRDRQLMGDLMRVVSTRIHRLAGSRLRGFNKDTAQEILLKAEFEIFGLLLAETPSLDSEFLEIAFGDIVVKRTLNAIRAHQRSIFGKRRGDLHPGATDEDGDEIERPIELAADDRAGFETNVIRVRDVEKAREAVKDPRHFEAVRLHFGDGMPIFDISKHLSISEGRVRYGLRAGMKAIRKAFGVENDQE